MRILYSHRIQSHDGQSVHLEELVGALRDAGHEVRVVGPSFYADAKLGAESRTTAFLRHLLPGMLTELAELLYNVAACWRLERVAAEFQPDIIYERYNLYYLAGAWLARRRGILFYVEVNSPLADERVRYGRLRLAGLARRAERLVWRTADRVFAVTDNLKQRVVTAGVPETRVVITPNGVVPERFPVRNSEPAAGDGETVVLGFIGFVRAWHRLESVIRELARTVPKILLVVAGDGPARRDLERLAESLGCAERVRFTGLVARENVPDTLAGFDIALQPHALVYASPLKLFEYMAAGLAIVAPDQPNIREIVVAEESALLFDPERDGAMWEAIVRLASDPELRIRLGHAARESVRRRDFTWRGNAQRIASFAEADLAQRCDTRRGRK
ncbi:MAG: glycosyltransferase family 4 protein [Acetobacteraceae bacterium]